MTTTRRLAAILAADVVGYSRLMGADEEGTLKRLVEIRQSVIDPAVGKTGGRIVKTTGDGFLIEFPSAVEAVRCALDIQEQTREHEEERSPDQRFQFRIGINVGDVIASDDDIHGDGVNVAARLEALAEPGGILVSANAHAMAVGRLKCTFEDMGEQRLKNIAQPVRAYRVTQATASSERPSLPLPDKPSIAVLPFANMSGDPEQEYFADGMVAEIITALSRFRQLFVIARNSSFTYKGRAVDVKQVGRELGVRYVLEGSVRKAASRVRITGQLIDAATSVHLWADRFDGGLEDVFDLQDKVTASVVSAIAPTVQKAEIERARRKPTDSLDAYDCFLHGMANAHQYSSREANDEAFRLFTRTIELDPEFASAYAMAAQCLMIRKASGWRLDPAKETAEGVRLARRAVELGKDDADALSLGGIVLAHLGRNFDAGVAHVDRALALNPNLAAALSRAGWFKVWASEPDAAVECFSRAMRLSPLDPFLPGNHIGMAHAHFFAGRYEEAASVAAMLLRERPDYHDGLRIDAASNALAGRPEEAAKAMARLRQLDPNLRVSKLREIQGPYRRSEDHTRYEEGMRKAGLPE